MVWRMMSQPLLLLLLLSNLLALFRSERSSSAASAVALMHSAPSSQATSPHAAVPLTAWTAPPFLCSSPVSPKAQQARPRSDLFATFGTPKRHSPALSLVQMSGGSKGGQGRARMQMSGGSKGGQGRARRVIRCVGSVRGGGARHGASKFVSVRQGGAGRYVRGYGTGGHHSEREALRRLRRCRSASPPSFPHLMVRDVMPLAAEGQGARRTAFCTFRKCCQHTASTSATRWWSLPARASRSGPSSTPILLFLIRVSATRRAR